MKIEEDTVVQINYQLSDASENTLVESDQGVPMAYLHGHNNLLPALEEHMQGRQAGDKFSVTLTPDQAYGEREDNKEQRIPIKHLQGAKKWKQGMIAVVNQEQGQRQVTVVKAGKFMVTVDFNHPFAGKTLQFDIEVVSVRSATAEEIAHGHAHGEGGHRH